MELLNPTIYVATIVSAKPELIKISEIVGKYCGESTRQYFINTFDKLDVGIANKILDKTVYGMKIIDENDVSEAIYQFCKKFVPDLCREISDIDFEFRKPSVINRHYREFYQAMNS